MSALFDGADCGPSNALSSVVKHAEADRSLQRDRVGGPSSSQLRHLPSTATRGPSEADQAFARRFFDPNSRNASPGPVIAAAAPFPAMYGAQLNAARAAPSFAGPKSPEPLNELWGIQGSSRAETSRSTPPISMSDPRASAWMSEFAAGPATPVEQLQQPSIQQAGPTYNPYMGASAGMYGPQMFQSPMMQAPLAYAQMPMGAVNQQHQPDWDSEFSKVVETTKIDKGKGRLVEVTDDGLEEAFRQLDVDSKAADPTASLDDYMASFEKVWEEVKSQNPGASLEELSKMEADYRQLLQQQNELDGTDPDLLAEMNEGWSNGYGLDMEGYDNDFGMNKLNGAPRYDENGVPALEQYAFEPENPFLASPTSVLLDQAKHLLATNGSLDEAALLCEAAIQKGELGEGGYEAWILLGQARSMDEREAQALRALREGTTIAQRSGNMEVGMLDLAISYVNESYDLASHYCLRQWLYSKYKDMNLPEHPPTHYNSAWSSHELTSEAFLQVARTLHATGRTDPDVQASLGVLFYSNAEFDKAKDCFENALQSRPDDWLLWNRLGSSLSNGAKPEEALGAYREALRLRPTYTRAIYNVGVACLNIGAHKEAVEHFLHALTLRGSDRETPGGAPSAETPDMRSADQIWQTLNRAFLAMNREDLVVAAREGDVNVFRSEFDF